MLASCQAKINLCFYQSFNALSCSIDTLYNLSRAQIMLSFFLFMQEDIYDSFDMFIGVHRTKMSAVYTKHPNLALIEI